MLGLITTGESKNGAPLTMSSREIADLLGKRHDNIKVSVERLADRGVIGTPALQEFTHNGNVYFEYRLNKRDSVILVAQNCPEFTAAIVDRWQELEAKVAKPAELSRLDILTLAMEAEKGRLEAEAKLALAAPKVDFFDKYADSGNATGFRETCKSLRVNEARFREFLLSEGIMYRLGGRLMAMQHHIDAGRFITVAGVSQRNEYAFTEAKFTRKGITWIAGEWGKYQLRTQQDVA